MKLKLLITLFSIPVFCFAQNPDAKRTNHWFFGTNGGLDFSSGTAVADTNGKMTVLEGSATMSDTAGNLLFYTDGKTVWNALHDTMMNGTGLGVGNFATPRQGALIVPKPGSNNIYYIFTVDGFEHQWQNGLQYSIVDMTLNSGLGGVTQKNIVLFAPSTEQLAGLKDVSGCGYWIVSHERYTDKFRAYHVTNAGVDTNAVITAIGADYGYQSTINFVIGGLELDFALNGNYAAVLNNWGYVATGIQDTLELYQFNSATGVFYNEITLPVDSFLFAIGFSPDNTKLYQASGWQLGKLYQYDISNYNFNSINSSKVLIYSGNVEIPADFQNGKDGKLYGSTETKQYLRAIQNPNASGLACNFVINDTYLGGRNALALLPDFIQSYFEDSSTLCVTAINEIENSPNILPNLAMDWIDIRGNDFEQLQLFDLTGRLIFTSFLKAISSEQRINVSSLPRGIYIISLSSKQKSVNQKIILK